jgi:hypothetical protein
MSILRTERPQKVLLFTKKGWQACPPTREESGSEAAPPQLGIGFPGFSRGTYDVGGHIVMAFGLRHPQGASGELMSRAAQYILSLPTMN